jgi:hypothetical protein
MRSLRLSRGRIARLIVELALVSFTLWLVAQNAMLLVLNPGKETPAPLIVLGAALKVAMVLVERLWPWMLGAALAAGLMAAALTHAPARREVRHV